tara:strand:- start:662 stop:922 length:261 start_codon:yes stop_codon:yes gene_type:complete
LFSHFEKNLRFGTEFYLHQLKELSIWQSCSSCCEILGLLLTESATELDKIIPINVEKIRRKEVMRIGFGVVCKKKIRGSFFLCPVQ